MKLKNYLIYFFLLFITFSSFSQKENQPKTEETHKKKNEFWKKVTFGGGLGLNFSNSITTVSIAPTAVYNFNPKFSSGIGFNFGYSNFAIDNIKQFNYGASLIGLYNPFNGLQLSTEFEFMHVSQTQEFAGNKLKNNFNFPALYIGAGYRLNNITAGLRYDVLYNENKTIYRSPFTPFVRVFF